jgi:type VI secretion system secreted protein VgrG
MGENLQQNRKLRVTTPLGENELLLKSFSGSEAISTLFGYRLEMIAENKTKVAFDAILGQKLTIHLQLPDERTETHLNGLCVRFAQAGRDADFTIYEAEIVPDVWKLTRKAQSRIFQRKTVPEILAKVFEGFNVEWQFVGRYEPRDFCVQYRETDYNFGARLMEEEGIRYFFQHSNGNHKMIVSDNAGQHPDLPGEKDLIYEELEGGVRDENRIWGWKKEQEIRPGKYVLWDHCFELPHKHLEAEAVIRPNVPVGKETHNLKVAGVDQLEVYDFPGEYAQRFDGVSAGGGEQSAELQKIFQDNRRTVAIRMDEETMPAIVLRAKSNAKHMAAGFRFTLKRHFNADGPYVITSVRHQGSFGADYRSGKEALLSYGNDLTCIPAPLAYRPPRATPKPVVQGSQTAVVVGPSGEEIFTDKYGRVKVQFHWDREGKNDENSSCWLRVGQLMAGRRWGASFWPRIGQEVIVDFLEGDPDQPIIVGTVYNADQMPPYLGQGPDSKHRNDNKVSGFKSNTTKGGQGFNELRFDDTKDKEQVFTHAERNMDTRVKSSSMESVGSQKHVTVGGEKDGQTWGEYREHTYKDKHVAVDGGLCARLGDAKVLVGGGDGGGNLHLYVEGWSYTTVDGSAQMHVKGQTVANLDQGLCVNASFIGVKTTDDFICQTGQGFSMRSGTSILLSAPQICLKGAGGYINIDASGVTIVGTMVKINSGGSASEAASLTQPSATDAEKAGPTLPVAADDAKTGQKSC